MNNLKNKERIEKRADFYREDIENIATWLYEHPEIALQEFESSKMLSQYMRKQGFEVIEELAGMKTAWKATKKNGTKGPKVCFMAEYDALPVGHACGHHMIAAMSVGAACVLADILQDYEGEVTVVGTPAEETGDGKTYLADQHVFDDYDLALSLHPCYQTIVCPNMIAIGGKDFKFTGKAAHAGANPYDGVNALDATILFFNNINALRQQIKDGTRIHGIIVEAGKAANIIPDEGKVRLEWRSKDQEYFDEITQKIDRCAEAAALATGCSLESDWFEPICKGLRHSEVLTGLVSDIMQGYGMVLDKDVFNGSTDVGNVSHIIPTLSPMYSVTESPDYGLHTSEFLAATRLPYATERLLLGVKVLSIAGLAAFEDAQLLDSLRKEKAEIQKK